MRNTILIIIILKLIPALAIEPELENGLNKINQQIQTIQTNLTILNEQHLIIQKNLDVIRQSNEKTKRQKKEIANYLKQKNDELIQINKKNGSVEKGIQNERDLISQEEKKIKEFEMMILQLKNNRQQREQNITQYLEEIRKLNEDKKLWINQIQYLKDLELKNNSIGKQIANEESTWKQKSKKSLNELNQWQKLQYKHDQLKTDIQALLSY